MFDSRVKLLSDYAERYLVNSEKIHKGEGFWGRLMALFSSNERSFALSGAQGEDLKKNETELLESGYAPFCEIDGRRIYFRKKAESCEVIIRQNDQSWDLSEWSSGRSFITRLIAECYFMVTRDDFRIDDTEQKVIHALIGYLEPSLDEIVEARNMVYWTLIENVIEDDLVTEEESDTMLKIREALQIKEEDTYALHTKALNERYEQLKYETHDDEQIDLMKLAKIRQMAEKLGVDTENFN